jgi:putative ABC transport system permease protein
MGAVRVKTLADLRRRRLQSGVIAVVLFLASAAATLALAILAESNAPFEHAFARANGAHLVVDYGPSVGSDAVAATGHASSVTASAGPWPVTAGSLGHPKGGRIGGGQFSGRPTPDRSIDAVTILAGRWWQASGEAVLDQDTARLLDKAVGDSITVYPPTDGKQPVPADAPGRVLTVVGVAASVSTPDVAVWMSPDDVTAVNPRHAPALQMLYRVDPSGSEPDLRSALANITAPLPPDGVVNSRTYLAVKTGVDRLADLYVPVLLAFSVFALLAAAFAIANVVSGVVLSGYRSIGVMKAIGFTPTQVTSTLLGQILVPVIVGVIAGVIVGTVASMPIIEQTASSFGLPGEATFSWQIIAAVLAVTLATAVIAAIGPAIRAGRLSAVGAMTRGTAPSTHVAGGRLRRLGMRLPVAIQLRLGTAAGLAHPGRASMTLGALVVGVAALTFSIGLNSSLLRVMADLGRSEPSPVRVELMDPSVPADHVTSAIATDPRTARSVAIAQVKPTVPRAGTVPFIGYKGESDWIGYALIRGRWFASPGEVVAPTAFFTQTGLHVGDTATATIGDRQITVRLVGEIFDLADETDAHMLIRGTWSDLAALDPSATPTMWEAQPVAGTAPDDYRMGLGDAIGRGVQVFVQGDSSSDASFLLFLAVVGVLGAVLVVISLGGVFNTVLLETQQRTREIAVLKAIGMSPTQVVAMVLASIAPVAITAGLIGVPLGLLAQHVVLTYMGEVAAGTDIPAATFDVFTPVMFVILGLSGLAIGAAGAYLPARRAARARIAPVLQAE